MRLRIEPEGRKSAIGVCLDGLRDQSVKRERFVERARHQGLEDIGVQPLRGRSGLQVERIETIESTEKSDGQTAAFQRGGIGIGQMIEVVV